MHKDIVPLEELTEQEIAQVGGAGKADPAKCSKNFNLPFGFGGKPAKESNILF